MSVLPNELSSFTAPLYGVHVSVNEASVERKINHIWQVLEETNNNLSACDQLLEHYSSRVQFSEHANLHDVSTQTSLPSEMSSSTQTCVPSSVDMVAQTFSPYLNSSIHMATQTSFDQSEGTDTGTQTCVFKGSAIQTNFEQEMQNVGLQTQSCGCSPSSIEFEKNSDKCWSQHRGWRLCDKHYEALRLCGNCFEFNELQDNKTAHMAERMDMKMLQGHQKIVNCLSSLEHHCQDMDVRLRSILSLLETLTKEIQSSVSRVFNQETMQEKQQNKEMGSKTKEVLATDKQTVEEIQSGCRCSKDQAIQEMRVLNGRLVELEKMLAAERNNVVHLCKSRALLSAQIRATKCGLMEERFSKDSLSHKTARLNQKNSHLKARLLYSRAQYRSQLADARHMLGSRNNKVNQLRSALVKVRDLCHSIDSSYRTMLWEIGNQVQLIAEMVARNCHLEWSQGPIVAIPTAADLKEWYQHIWHTTRWIQLHIPSHQLCVQQSSQAEGNKPSRTSSAHPNPTPMPLYNVKTDTSSPHVAGNNSDFSFDLELSLDMSNTVQPTAICSADLDNTTCSSLSQDLSWQHEASQDRYQMQHRFLTILDNLKVKLLQLKPSSIQ